MLRRWVLPGGALVGLLALVLGLSLRDPGPAAEVREDGDEVSLSDLVDNRPPRPGPAPSPTAEVPDEVRIEVGDDAQAMVDATPPGTTFRFASGVHREVSIIPRDGDRFVGDAGAVLSGARDLSDADWRRVEPGLWVVGGQTQQGLVHGQIVDGGNPNDRYPEEVFVDGRRLRHVGSVGEVGPDAWYLDYDRDELYLGADPSGFGSVEVSTTVGAFGGTGVRDVVIEGLTIERYATPAQHGAIGFLEEHWTYDWTIRDTIVRQNHGAGIRLGPGMTLERVRVLDNGQLGAGGDAIDRSDGHTGGYEAPITITDCEFAGNGVLDFDWTWESGGVKVKHAMAGSVFERNVVRDNDGPGAWWDIDDRDAVIRDNLVEDNAVLGIFYEISFGDALIEGNTVRRNGPRDAERPAFGVGIFVSNSSGVVVRDNLIEDQAFPIVLHAVDRGVSDRLGPRELTDVVVSGNTIVRSGPAGLTAPEATGLTWSGNTYDSTDGSPPEFLLGDERVPASRWQAAGYDRDLTLR